ncbi:MAG: hypothetical protein K2M13_07695 [Muribaculaceae bacterium]|nr:hypothetical protein [Muribaculaceae bacterium]
MKTLQTKLTQFLLRERLIFAFPLLIAAMLLPLSLHADSKKAFKANKGLLTRLDSLIRNHDKIVMAKEKRIGLLKEEYKHSVTPERKFDLVKALYNEYQVYNPDSAMFYADEASRISEKCFPDDPQKQAECKLFTIFINATQGFGAEAVEVLESIDPASLSTPYKVLYYQTGQYIYSCRALFNDTVNFKSDPWMAKSNAYRDSLFKLDPNRTINTLWIPVARQIDNDADDYHVDPEVIALLEKGVETHTDASRENAINAYWLARHYKRMGDDEKMLRYMTMASIYDAEIENREIAAITELATWLFEQGDIDRAYNYLLYSSDQANAYRNRARMLNISSILGTVHDAYLKAIVERDKRLHNYLIALIALSVIILAATGIIIRENRRLRTTRKALTDSNTQLEKSLEARDQAISALEDANAALAESNHILHEANKVKQGLVALSFRLASEHINALDDYRKKLLKKFKAKNYTELGAELQDQELIRDPYRNFYAAFDHTMLSIFPDLIQEYNSFSSPESKIDPETIDKSRTLNTRIRIFALRKLGVEKSADIAKMLNVSIRTVYNNHA